MNGLEAACIRADVPASEIYLRAGEYVRLYALTGELPLRTVILQVDADGNPRLYSDLVAEPLEVLDDG